MKSSGTLLGVDLGSSSIKVSLLHAETGKLLGSATSPSTEMAMQSAKPGWAEQDPEMWWKHTLDATKQLFSRPEADAQSVIAIGISYQMHGLVAVDKRGKVLRPSIIWCDSRAVPYGDEAESALGESYCRNHLLNSPGNFTASKLKWVKENEPDVFRQVDKIMLPGDYLAMRLTGVIATTVSGLSEGIMWDFKDKKIAARLFDYYGLDRALVPEIVPTFGVQGELTTEAARATGLKAGTPVTYRAGDQPNNAFSLKTLEPGELAATAGTSGVIYGVVDNLASDPLSRVNTFVHVNNSDETSRLGILLCVNGTGIMNSWLRRNIQVQGDLTYQQMNALAAKAPIGSDGLCMLPFGNGAERVFQNRELGASVHHLNLNRHDASHLCRAAQEGIVFSLAYGFEILKDLGLVSTIVRAGKANMFLSEIFCDTFSNVTNTVVELYNTDGAQGAARAAGVGAGFYSGPEAAFGGLACLERYEPDAKRTQAFADGYGRWKEVLDDTLGRN